MEVNDMYGKLIIECQIRVVTGLHIGGSDVYSFIGAVDSYVVSDPLTQKPIIPGSSLKGKIRTLLSRINTEKRCEPNQDPEMIKRLFGSSDPVRYSRLQFSDAKVINSSDFVGIGLTEIKFENTISRVTSVANPRQIERVVSGVVFKEIITYNIENLDELEEDIENLSKGIQLLQLDYLGGHGSRGSGRINFDSIKVSPEFIELDPATIDKLTDMLNKAVNYDPLPD